MTSMDNKLTTVSVRPGAIGGEVLVAGQDVSRMVTRATVDLSAKEAPRVYLELVPDAPPESIECEAVVHVVREAPADVVQVIRDWLAPLDGKELEKSALEAMELGGPQTFGEAVLEVLREAVRGDGDGS